MEASAVRWTFGIVIVGILAVLALSGNAAAVEDPTGNVCVGLWGESCETVAVGVLSGARADVVAVAVLGNAEADAVAVAPIGDAEGTHYWSSPVVAIAGLGDARGNVAVAGGGSADGHRAGVSLLNDASGNVAVSGTGQADGNTASASACETAQNQAGTGALCVKPTPALSRPDQPGGTVSGLLP